MKNATCKRLTNSDYMFHVLSCIIYMHSIFFFFFYMHSSKNELRPYPVVLTLSDSTLILVFSDGVTYKANQVLVQMEW